MRREEGRGREEEKGEKRDEPQAATLVGREMLEPCMPLIRAVPISAAKYGSSPNCGPIINQFLSLYIIIK